MGSFPDSIRGVWNFLNEWVAWNRSPSYPVYFRGWSVRCWTPGVPRVWPFFLVLRGSILRILSLSRLHRFFLTQWFVIYHLGEGHLVGGVHPRWCWVGWLWCRIASIRGARTSSLGVTYVIFFSQFNFVLFYSTYKEKNLLITIQF